MEWFTVLTSGQQALGSGAVAILSALVSGIVSIVVSLLTFRLTMKQLRLTWKRERETVMEEEFGHMCTAVTDYLSVKTPLSQRQALGSVRVVYTKVPDAVVPYLDMLIRALETGDDTVAGEALSRASQEYRQAKRARRRADQP